MESQNGVGGGSVFKHPIVAEENQCSTACTGRVVLFVLCERKVVQKCFPTSGRARKIVQRWFFKIFSKTRLPSERLYGGVKVTPQVFNPIKRGFDFIWVVLFVLCERKVVQRCFPTSGRARKIVKRWFFKFFSKTRLPNERLSVSLGSLM